MRVAIKAGGSLLDDSSARNLIARQFAEMAREHEVIVIHGGGKQVTRFLENRGVSSRFVRGLRVSDEPVIDAVTKVIAGSVNKELVAAIRAAGEAAVGLSGVDGCLTIAEKLDEELGMVGKPVKTDPRLLDLLVNAGYLPVIACIAGDEKGGIYNVNADQMATSCASGWPAETLIFLTDVPGVRGAQGATIPELAGDEIAELITLGIASGGMQAKLEAAKSALDGGIDEVIIASGHEPDICRRLVGGEKVGTRVFRKPMARRVPA